MKIKYIFILLLFNWTLGAEIPFEGSLVSFNNRERVVNFLVKNVSNKPIFVRKNDLLNFSYAITLNRVSISASRVAKGKEQDEFIFFERGETKKFSSVIAIYDDVILDEWESIELEFLCDYFQAGAMEKKSFDFTISGPK